MTIYDISKEAGVSIATVSRVLNGNDNVRPKTRQKVMEVIEKYEYTPNAFARGLGLNTMQAVGIMCADCSDMFLAKAIYYVEKNLREQGYETILTSTGYDLQGKQEALSLLLKRRVDSIIMIGSNFIFDNDDDNKYIRDAAEQVPVMMLNGDFDCKNVFCTYCDDFQASFDATDQLIKSGAKRILHLYDATSFSGKRKLSGYQGALLSNDIEVDKNLSQFYSGNRESAHDIASFLQEIKEQGIEFDAISCSNDYMAMGALRFARLNKIKVPEELQICGYNNTVLTTCAYPEMTSVDNRVEQISNQLVHTLVEVLSGVEMPQKTLVSGQLVKRDSTK